MPEWQNNQWSEKGEKRGVQLYLWCGKWPKTENCHLQFSCIVLLIHVQLWGVKSHSKPKLLEYFFLNVKDLQKHLSIKRSLDQSMDSISWNLGLCPYFIFSCPDSKASLTHFCHISTRLEVHSLHWYNSGFCLSKSGTELGIRSPLFPEVQVIQ